MKTRRQVKLSAKLVSKWFDSEDAIFDQMCVAAGEAMQRMGIDPSPRRGTRVLSMKRRAHRRHLARLEKRK